MPSREPSLLRPRRATLAPGVRLHVLATDRFATTVCRVAFHRDLGREATATALLGQLLGSATADHPTREALAHRLADLYGAGLHVGVERLGDRQLLAASLDWPTRGVPGRGATLSEGLGFLREVLTRPLREGHGPALDHAAVATEARNLVRSLRSIRDDKARYATRRCLELACEGEPYALDVEGREEDVAAATPAALAEVHARLLATAPVEIHLAGDVSFTEAVAAVRKHLLWDTRAKRPTPAPPAWSTRAPRRRAVRRVEKDSVSQGKLVMAFRADLEPGSPLLPAALVLAGVLGGSPASRLFKVVRETHGLAYYASSSWVAAKGLLVVQSGIETKNEARVRRLVLSLAREVAGGRLDDLAWQAVREAARSRVRAMRDDRGSAIGFEQEASALGLDPRPERRLAALEAVTPADVRRVGKRLALDASFFLAGEAKDGAAGAAS